MSTGNIPADLRTHIDSIQLVALLREKWLDKDKLFRHIVKDLKILEEFGVEVCPGKFLKGGLVNISGDNLGYAVGCYQENFSTTEYFCRFCLMIRDQFFTLLGNSFGIVEETYIRKTATL